MIGRTIAHYEILEKLGEGGMGVVYKARDGHLHRPVALKVLPPEKLADAERKQRFVREARAASSLNHPNIVHIYDIDRRDGVDYIAMEYVEGKTLDCLIPSGGMKLNDALRYAIQIAGALARAHAAGIVHRDLKPANVMISRDGRAIVLDFGLAKLTETAESPGETTATGIASTEVGVIVGTVPYMSPEQAEGKKVDARSDIFSFGTLLYEMVTGRRPFQRDTGALTLAAILHLPPPPLPPGTPPALEAILERCLRKDPDRRYQDLNDVRIALEDLKEESDSARRTAAPAAAPSAGRRGRRIVLAAAAAGALVLAGAHIWRRAHAPPLTDKDILVLADFTNTTGDPVFDVTLRQALAAQLEESPFLKVIGDEQMRQDLRFMGLPSSERISNQVAREICLREGHKAMIAGSIARLDRTYAIALEATNCRTGEALAREQGEAADKDHVLRTVGALTTKIRAKLGESLASIQKLSGPSVQVTTASLDAFQAYALGRAQASLGEPLSAIPLLERATQLDPNFAMAYQALGAQYCIAGESRSCAEAMKRAFSLVDRVSERERLTISTYYYRNASGELGKAADECQLMARTYPREAVAHNQLGQVYRSLGEWEKALPEYIEAARLDPSWTYTVANQVLMYSYLGRFDEAKAVAARAAARNVDSANIRRALLVAAYGQGDRAGAEREIQWLAGKPEEYQSLRLQAADAAALGQRRRSRQLLQRGAEILEQKNLPEAAASFLAREALVEALDGSCPDSLRLAGAAAKHSQAPGDMVEIALARALCGDAGEALKATEETSRRYPLDTLLIAVHQPSMRAAIELSQKRPEAAIEMLRPAKPYERAYAYAPYLRGIALLRMGKGLEASAEFQKVLDQKAVHWGPYYPLALAGLARASSLAGDPVRARKAYQDLLALWKDADPDLPVLKEVRQEYARLR